jgi:predicted ABC-type ATPase
LEIKAPNVVLLAGPNGAGKSTAAPYLLRGELRVSEFVNADTIAQGLSAYSPQTVSIDAGRLMLRRLRELAARRADFAFETTLASRTFAPWIRDLVSSGYEFRIVFLWLPSPDLCVARVSERARRGGHVVPEATVRRRYETGIRNFFTLYRPLATSWRFYSNTAATPHLVAEGAGPVVTAHDESLWSRLEARYLHGGGD